MASETSRDDKQEAIVLVVFVVLALLLIAFVGATEAPQTLAANLWAAPSDSDPARLDIGL